MSLVADKAAAYAGPVAGTFVAGRSQVLYRASASATNTALTLPAGVAGSWIDLYSSDVSFQYAFGVGSAPTLVYNEAVTIGTGDVNAGQTLPPGIVHSRLVPKDATHIALITDASPTGRWEIVQTEVPAI